MLVRKRNGGHKLVNLGFDLSQSLYERFGDLLRWKTPQLVGNYGDPVEDTPEHSSNITALLCRGV